MASHVIDDRLVRYAVSMRPGAPLLLVGVVLVLLAPAVDAGAAETTLQGEGRVVALDRSKGSITVEHGTLGRLFVAGLTEFPVGATDLLERVRIGDRVVFEVVASADGHGVPTISDIEVLAREPRSTPGVGITLRDAGLATLVALLAAIAGLLGLQTRRLRRLIQGSDAMVAGLREQLRLQREMSSSVEAAVAALLPALRGYQSDVRRVGERIQVAVDPARSEPAAPPDTARPIVIVRRGETETFRTLDERLGKPGLARVVWDRRRRERRSTSRPPGAERRRRDRRAPTPVTWEGLGYLVVQPKARHLNVVA